MYWVDTNVISEVRKREQADPGVMAFFWQAALEDTGLYLSVVTVAELRRGVELIRHRGDKPQATRSHGVPDRVARPPVIDRRAA
ncbi:hypothetical protein SAMN04487768_0436 [Burkholderia sp. b13]|nr:hypothetical protein SAMN04487768_0436 [Burkholderia sp. b13]